MSAADLRPASSSDAATKAIHPHVHAPDHANMTSPCARPIPKTVLTETKHAVTTIRRLTSQKIKAEHGLNKLTDMNRPPPKSLRINNKSSFSSHVDPQVANDFEKAKDEAASALRTTLIRAKESEIANIKTSITATAHDLTAMLFSMAAAITDETECSACAVPVSIPANDDGIIRSKKRIRAHTLQADVAPEAPMAIDMINNATLNLSKLSAHQLKYLEQWTDHFHLQRQDAVNDVITQNIKTIAMLKAKEEKFRLAKEAEARMTVDEKMNLLMDRKIKKALSNPKPQQQRGRSTKPKPKPKPKSSSKKPTSRSQSRQPSRPRRQPSRPNANRSQPRRQSKNSKRPPNARGAGSAPKRNVRFTSRAPGRGKNNRS
jgi:hypothetical protein